MFISILIKSCGKGLITKEYIPYSGLFSNRKFSHKCLNINFGGFYFRSQYIYFEVAIASYAVISVYAMILRHSSSAVKI